MKKWLIGMVPLMIGFVTPAMAFNLWQDIQQQSQFPIGSVVNVGLGINLRTGNSAATALAEVYQYRFLEASWGGIAAQQDTSTGTSVKLNDMLQVGLRSQSLFTGFLNQPPAWLQNIEVGPAISYPLLSALTGDQQFQWKKPDYWVVASWRFGK